jgi:hypothetical protein
MRVRLTVSVLALALQISVGCSGREKETPRIPLGTTLVFPDGFACDGDYVCRWKGPSDAILAASFSFRRTEEGECRTAGGRVDEATGLVHLDEDDGIVRRIRSGEAQAPPEPGAFTCFRRNVDP